MLCRAKSVVLFLVVVCSLLILSACSQGEKAQTEVKANADSWFTVTELADNTWRIESKGAVNSYLVTGEEQALLIDTGHGVGDLKACVEGITNLPIIVVNTHAHPDHSGGNYLFDEVYVHEADVSSSFDYSSEEAHQRNLQQMGQQFPELKSTFVPSVAVNSSTSTMSLKDGHVFDLGGRQLEVIAVPGHTPGSIVLLDAENRMLFAGDNTNAHSWLFLDVCLPLEAFQASLAKLNARRNAFDVIYPGHHGPLGVDFLAEQIECVRQIVDGEAQAVPYQQAHADTALLHTYKRAEIAYNPNNIHL